MSVAGQHVPRIVAYEGQTVLLRARLAGHEGALLTQAATNSIDWAVYDLTGGTPNVAIVTGTGAIADCITDAPVPTADWPFENSGPNFTLGLPWGSGAGQVPFKGARRYEIVVTVDHDLASGPTAAFNDGPFKLVYELYVKPLQQAG